jgi:hypothetical protein
LVDGYFAIGESLYFCGEKYFSFGREEMYRLSAIALIVLLIIGSLSSCSQKSNNSKAVIQPSPTRAAATPNDTLKVSFVKEPFIDGCGCFLHLPEDYNKEDRGYIFLGGLEDSAQMNFDGKDVILKEVRRIDAEGDIKIGSTRNVFYKSGNIDVEVEYVVKGLCEPDDTECESTEYSATITVTRNGMAQKISALGSCGC